MSTIIEQLCASSGTTPPNVDIDNGVTAKFVGDFLLIQLKGYGVMAIEIELALKWQI